MAYTKAEQAAIDRASAWRQTPEYKEAMKQVDIYGGGAGAPPSTVPPYTPPYVPPTVPPVVPTPSPATIEQLRAAEERARREHEAYVARLREEAGWSGIPKEDPVYAKGAVTKTWINAKIASYELLKAENAEDNYYNPKLDEAISFLKSVDPNKYTASELSKEMLSRAGKPLSTADFQALAVVTPSPTPSPTPEYSQTLSTGTEMGPFTQYLQGMGLDTPTTTTPREGEEKWIGNQKYVFFEGRWRLSLTVPPTTTPYVPPYVPPTVPPYTPPTTTPYVPPTTTPYVSPTTSTYVPPTTPTTAMTLTEGGEMGPFAQYLKAVGLGAGYMSPSQRYLESLYEPLRGLFGLEQTFAPLTGMQQGYWGNYMQPYLGGVQSMFGRSGDILSSLFGATPGQRGELGYSFEPAYNPLSGQTEYEGEGMGTLQDLLTYALRSRWGFQGAGRFASRLPQLQQQWERQQPEMGFIDYLKSKYGLGGMF